MGIICITNTLLVINYVHTKDLCMKYFDTKGTTSNDIFSTLSLLIKYISYGMV